MKSKTNKCKHRNTTEKNQNKKSWYFEKIKKTENLLLNKKDVK